MGLMFERLPKESAKAFAAFSFYLNMGPQRSAREVGERLGKSETLISRWSTKFDWAGRIMAHGAYVAEVQREALAVEARAKAVEWSTREQKLMETEWVYHERAIAAAKKALDAFMEKEKVFANLSDIARMLEIASKLGRLATGLNTDGERNRTNTTTVNVEVNLALQKVYGEPLPWENAEVVPPGQLPEKL